MSLLTDQMEDFVVLNKVRIADGYGGIKTTWTDGATIKAVAPFNSSMEARIGAVQGVSSVYTITTSRRINLQYHDVLRRVRDGKIFRVTSDGDDQYTPAMATLDMRNVTAEEWTLPVDEVAGGTNNG